MAGGEDVVPVRPNLASSRRRARMLLRLGWLLFLRDFRYRYRQTYLGYVWAVSRLLFGGLPLILVGSHFGLGAGRTPVTYAVYALTGYILWQILWDSLNYPQWFGRRLRKTVADTAFPREALLVGAACYVLFNTSVYLPLLAVAFVAFQVPPPPTVVLGLLAVPVIVLAGLTIGAVIVPLTFVYLDFRYGLPFLSSVLLWTAPILYAPPERGVLRVVSTWNPLTYLIDVPRHWIVSGFRAGDVTFLLSTVVCAGLFVASLRFYRRMMPRAIQCLVRT